MRVSLFGCPVRDMVTRMCAATAAAMRKGGGNVTLSALADELGSVSVILEWATEEGQSLDADVSALLLGDDGKV